MAERPGSGPVGPPGSIPALFAAPGPSGAAAMQGSDGTPWVNPCASPRRMLPWARRGPHSRVSRTGTGQRLFCAPRGEDGQASPPQHRLDAPPRPLRMVWVWGGGPPGDAPGSVPHPGQCVERRDLSPYRPCRAVFGHALDTGVWVDLGIGLGDRTRGAFGLASAPRLGAVPRTGGRGRAGLAEWGQGWHVTGLRPGRT